MEKACIADNEARMAGESASRKVAMIDEVVSMLNRNNAQEAALDPDTGFLKAVRFFLEPLSDGSLPAYDIQNKIFMQLECLPIGKEQLLGSGLGKVVFFYTKSKRPVPRIKRMANKLVEDWSRPILKRSHDYKKRQIEEREYDHQYVALFPFRPPHARRAN
jgi:transcription factor SPN1